MHTDWHIKYQLERTVPKQNNNNQHSLTYYIPIKGKVPKQNNNNPHRLTY